MADKVTSGRKTIIWLVIALTVLIVAGAYKAQESQIQVELGLIDKMGVPASFEALYKRAEAQGDDAQPDYARFADLKDRLTPEQQEAFDYIENSFRAKKPSADVIARTPELLKPLVDTLLAGAAKPRWNLQDLPPMMWDRHSKKCLQVNATQYYGIDLLGKFAVIDAKRGRTDAALQKLRASENIYRQLAAGPGISRGVRRKAAWITIML
jgi:hypothetical protein